MVAPDDAMMTRPQRETKLPVAQRYPWVGWWLWSGIKKLGPEGLRALAVRGAGTSAEAARKSLLNRTARQLGRRVDMTVTGVPRDG